MRVGQIGIITEWGIHNTHKGKTVIRAYKGLVDVFTGDLWGESVFIGDEMEMYRVKILKNGTELIICNNE